MNFSLKTPIEGQIILTDELHLHPHWLLRGDLYKFIWVCEGFVEVTIDHVPLHISAGEIVPLSPHHHLGFVAIEGCFVSLLFNGAFYCIFGGDKEVSCNGFLFNGSSQLMHLSLSEEEQKVLSGITEALEQEYENTDDLREEMLRMLLKHFIIACTRFARKRFSIFNDQEGGFDLIRRFYVLVDTHFKEKKQVQEYAELLHRSPKTLSNLFADYGLPSPLKVIHDRMEAEAKRLLLYTGKSAKEIGDLLGFEDSASFSRFFKKETGISISDFRKQEKRV